MPGRLENGQGFPEISAALVDGGRLRLPDDVRGSWSILLFYRGHW